MPSLVNRLNINGRLNGSDTVDRGALSVTGNASGSSHLPGVLDRTAIHYDTTEEWNSKRLLIGQVGHIYVYSDFKSKEVDGETVYIPGIKIGDGNSYLIDMPFISSGEDSSTIKAKSTSEWNSDPTIVGEANTIYVYIDKDGEGNITNTAFKIGDGMSYLIDIPFMSPSMQQFEDHINNTTVHVTQEERNFWNNKWRGYLDVAEGENLYFTVN